MNVSKTGTTIQFNKKPIVVNLINVMCIIYKIVKK